MELNPEKPEKQQSKRKYLPKLSSKLKSDSESKTKSSEREKNENKLLCHHCKKEGHKINTCRYKKRKEKTRQRQEAKQKEKSENNFKKFIANQFANVAKNLEMNEDIVAQITHIVTRDISTMLNERMEQILKTLINLIAPFRKIIHKNGNTDEDVVQYPQNKEKFEDREINAHDKKQSAKLTRMQAPERKENPTSQLNQTPSQHHSDFYIEGDDGGGDGSMSHSSSLSSLPEIKAHQAQSYPKVNNQIQIKQCWDQEEDRDQHDHNQDHDQHDHDQDYDQYYHDQVYDQHDHDQDHDQEQDQNQDYDEIQLNVYKNHMQKEYAAIETKKTIVLIDAQLSIIEKETPTKIRRPKQFYKRYVFIKKKKFLIHKNIFESVK